MTKKKTNTPRPFHPQAAAFIEAAKATAVQGNKNQDADELELLLADQNAKNEAIDHCNLVMAYGDPSIGNLTANCISYDVNENEIDIFDGQDHGPITHVLATEAFILTVHPKSTKKSYPWAIVHKNGSLYSPSEDEVPVYLFRPFVPGTRSTHVYWPAPIYWLENGKVIAAGTVHEIALSDIIVMRDGLLIPARAIQDFRHFSPFKPTSSTEKNECKEMLKMISKHGDDLKAHNALWIAEEGRGNDRLLPDLAVAFDGPLEGCIEEHINSEFSASMNATTGNTAVGRCQQ
jgi:hypothetical protein